MLPVVVAYADILVGHWTRSLNIIKEWSNFDGFNKFKAVVPLGLGKTMQS